MNQIYKIPGDTTIPSPTSSMALREAFCPGQGTNEEGRSIERTFTGTQLRQRTHSWRYRYETTGKRRCIIFSIDFDAVAKINKGSRAPSALSTRSKESPAQKSDSSVPSTPRAGGT